MRGLNRKNKDEYGKRYPVTCRCGSTFFVVKSRLSRSKSCSRTCQARANSEKRGPESSAWKGGRRIRSDGYVEVRTGGSGRPYELEHRAVAAAMIGRTLTFDDDVHHLNGIKTDNRPENLTVLTKKDHAKIHAAARG